MIEKTAPHTASRHISVLAEAFHFPLLDRTRKIWVYLPETYEGTGKRYPVLYMHDGQNLFDSLEAMSSEWGVDETMDKLGARCIVVGIANGEEHRMAEYTLYDHPDHGPAEGANYLRDVLETLKPFVDATLRTRPEREHTYMAGSSMGGLISLYAALYFPEIVGGVGIFSPSIWLVSPQIFTEAAGILHRSQEPQRWYFYAGGMESETMVADTGAMVQLIRQHPLHTVHYEVQGDGGHTEAAWGGQFRAFYFWLIGRVRKG